MMEMRSLALTAPPPDGYARDNDDQRQDKLARDAHHAHLRARHGDPAIFRRLRADRPSPSTSRRLHLQCGVRSALTIQTEVVLRLSARLQASPRLRWNLNLHRVGTEIHQYCIGIRPSSRRQANSVGGQLIWAWPRCGSPILCSSTDKRISFKVGQLCRLAVARPSPTM